MKTKAQPRFSTDSIKFLEKAGRQKSEKWLEKNRSDYERLILLPLQNLAQHLKSEIGPLAPDYHFPLKGIGRLKRSAASVAEHGGIRYKDWLSYSAARPRQSRFEHNPNIFFLINPEDSTGDTVLIAGGLYMPSSRQMRKLREAVAHDASEFEKLFKTKEFSQCFPGGFSDEKISSRFPAGFDRNHPRINWIRLQAFFVWKPYSKKEFSSADFPKMVARDAKQILRMNRIIEKLLRENIVTKAPKIKATNLFDRLDNVQGSQRQMDF